MNNPEWERQVAMHLHRLGIVDVTCRGGPDDGQQVVADVQNRRRVVPFWELPQNASQPWQAWLAVYVWHDEETLSFAGWIKGVSQAENPPGLSRPRNLGTLPNTLS
jgi:hypothetical protein